MLTEKPPKPEFCIAEGCDRPPGTRNLCQLHYERWRRGANLEEDTYHPRGEKSPQWRGGLVTRNPYVWKYVPIDHFLRPYATSQGYMMEHRFVMAELLGRALTREENVHHINGIKTDNRPENLELWSRAQPPGQRVADKIAWCKEFLAQYDTTTSGQIESTPDQPTS